MPETPQKHPAQAQAKPKQPVELDIRAPAETPANKPIEVKIEIDDPDQRASAIVLQWRRKQKGGAYSAIRPKFSAGTDRVTAIIPAGLVGDKPGTLTYYVEARDAKGKVVATAGDDLDPRKITLAPPKGGTKSKLTWWLVGIGSAAAVAGGVVAAVLLINADDDGRPPDTADLTVIIK